MGLFDVSNVSINGVEFNNVSLKDKKVFAEYYESNSYENVPFFGGFYSFYLPATLAGDKYLWKIINGALCFFQKHRNYIELSSMPLFKKKVGSKTLKKTFSEIFEVLNAVNEKHSIDFVYIVKGRIESFVDSDDFKAECKKFTVYDDFIFKCEDLINLAGKKYRTRRNMVNNFKKNYPNHVIRPYTVKDIPAIKKIRKLWKTEREDVIKDFWDDKIFEARINNLEDLEYRMVVAEVDGNIEGFIMLAPHCDNCLCVVMENTNIEIKGLTEYLWYEALRLNRDMGEFENDGGGYTPKHGLYHYKESHRPIHMLELLSFGTNKNIFE